MHTPLLELTPRFTFSSEFRRIAQAVQRIQSHYDASLRRCRNREEYRGSRFDRRNGERDLLTIPVLLHHAEQAGFAWRCSDLPPVIGMTRDLSCRGLGLCFDSPLASTFAIAEFDTGEEATRLLVELCWQRQRSRRNFSAGGRVLGVCSVNEID